MRSPETIETMLYYKANPIIRDRSGVSVINYHEKAVGNLDIIALFNQAKESQRVKKNHHVNGVSLEESNIEHQNGKEARLHIPSTSLREQAAKEK